MKSKNIIYYFVFAFILIGFQQCKAQQSNPENWTKEQLIEPAALAQTLQSNKNIPLIYCVGPGCGYSSFY